MSRTNMRSRRRGDSGFTLIELLTVIVIIGVLAGMISLAAVFAKRKALAVERTTDLAMIKSALESYRHEYQEWPCAEAKSASPPASVTYKANNRQVIEDYLMNSAAGRNENNIRFLNLGEYKRDENGNLIDYNRNFYEITFDFANDKVSVK